MKDFVNMIIPYIKGYLYEAITVMESKLLMEKLKEQSIKDQLTGFYNRRYIEEVIDPILNNAKRKGETMGILTLDIDHFKEVNDTYGHDAGDLVLKSVAQAIKESIRESDIPIRFGGEEFLVLLTNVKPGESENIAEKIRKNVENKVISLPNKTTLKKTISIGVQRYQQILINSGRLLSLQMSLFIKQKNLAKTKWLDIKKICGKKMNIKIKYNSLYGY
jgi:diguanylate cyclase (GGDEF)-like protein